MKLRAPREGVDHVVFLEDGLTLQAFIEFVDALAISTDHETIDTYYSGGKIDTAPVCCGRLGLFRRFWTWAAELAPGT